jgi:hypothetical protein
MIGFIYVMSNPAYPGSVKIGQTRKDPEERRKELGTTGVLQDFVLEYRALTEDYESLEKEIHKSLAKYRVRDDREFFSISPPAAINLIREIAGDRIESDKSFHIAPDELKRKKKEKEKKERQERERQARLARYNENQLKKRKQQEQDIINARKNADKWTYKDLPTGEKIFVNILCFGLAAVFMLWVMSFLLTFAYL